MKAVETAVGEQENPGERRLRISLARTTSLVRAFPMTAFKTAWVAHSASATTRAWGKTADFDGSVKVCARPLGQLSPSVT